MELVSACVVSEKKIVFTDSGEYWVVLRDISRPQKVEFEVVTEKFKSKVSEFSVFFLMFSSNVVLWRIVKKLQALLEELGRSL